MLLAAAATLLATALGRVSATTAPPAVAQLPTSPLPDRLVEAVGAPGAVRHLTALQKIADRSGGSRAAGTAGDVASVDLVAGLLRGAGFEVATPTFEFREQVVRAARLDAGGTGFRVDQLRQSPNTPVGGVTGPLVVLSGEQARGCSRDDLAGLPVAGAVLVAQRGGCTFATKAGRAAAAGAAALLVANQLDEPLRQATLGRDGPLPVAGVSRRDGELLAERAGRPATLDVRTEVETRTSRNVVAQTRTGGSEAVVMAGAHLDSVAGGPGINDNGSGAAGLLELALRLGSSPEVEQAVRFAWWGAEEIGLVGSEAYVAGLSGAARRDLALYLNVDMIASPNPGFFVYDGDDSERDGDGAGPAGSAELERTLLDRLERQGIQPEPTDLDGRSDYGPFSSAGVPVGGLFSGADSRKSAAQAERWGGRAGEPFDPCYHRACDDLGNIDADGYGHHLDALAWTVASYAVAGVRPAQREPARLPFPPWATVPWARPRVVSGRSRAR